GVRSVPFAALVVVLVSIVPSCAVAGRGMAAGLPWDHERRYFYVTEGSMRTFTFDKEPDLAKLPKLFVGAPPLSSYVTTQRSAPGAAHGRLGRKKTVMLQEPLVVVRAGAIVRIGA